jgi:hypothetical protein
MDTIINRAKKEVTGFSTMFAKLEQKVTLGGLSESTLVNYGWCIAKISLYFRRMAIRLDEEQINGYLFRLVEGRHTFQELFQTLCVWIKVLIQGLR